MEEPSQTPATTELMLEAPGPNGLFAVFQEDEGAGFFCAYMPETQEVLAQVCVYESGLNVSIRESDVQVMWSSDQTKCAVAVKGQMRAVINIAIGTATCAPLESNRLGIVDPEWLKGFEKHYLDQLQFVRARQRYWKEVAKEHVPVSRVYGDDETIPETNFVVYAVGPKEQFAVFEDEGETGYLYLYSSREQTLVRYLHVYDRTDKLNVSRDDVQVVWSRECVKCGVLIWGKMRGIIDVASDREGRVWLESRNTPGIGDVKWLEGF